MATALISPIVPIEIKSSGRVLLMVYFLATCATKRSCVLSIYFGPLHHLFDKPPHTSVHSLDNGGKRLRIADKTYKVEFDNILRASAYIEKMNMLYLVLMVHKTIYAVRGVLLSEIVRNRPASSSIREEDI